MTYTLRPYQQEAVDKAVSFLTDARQNRNAIEVLGTGSGKSLIIANIAARLGAPVLIFQPSKEILEQNLFTKIDTLRLPSAFSDQLTDAILTMVLLMIVFSVIAFVAWVVVLIIERREARRGIVTRGIVK